MHHNPNPNPNKGVWSKETRERSAGQADASGGFGARIRGSLRRAKQTHPEGLEQVHEETCKVLRLIDRGGGGG